MKSAYQQPKLSVEIFLTEEILADVITSSVTGTGLNITWEELIGSQPTV